MAKVTVTPEEWKFVFFDGGRIAAVAEKLLGEVGLDADVRIEVDETTPLGRASVTSLDPIVISAESGAFEDAKRPRQLSETAVADVVGKWLLRVRDRRDPAFGDPPADDQLNLAQVTAWDTYCVGRMARLGYAVQRQRRLYHFRNRHGFSDLADTAFEQLWNGVDLSWSDIQAVCDSTEPTRTPVG
jgi:hypothetical protein